MENTSWVRLEIESEGEKAAILHVARTKSTTQGDADLWQERPGHSRDIIQKYSIWLTGTVYRSSIVLLYVVSRASQNSAHLQR